MQRGDAQAYEPQGGWKCRTTRAQRPDSQVRLLLSLRWRRWDSRTWNATSSQPRSMDTAVMLEGIARMSLFGASTLVEQAMTLDLRELQTVILSRSSPSLMLATLMPIGCANLLLSMQELQSTNLRLKIDGHSLAPLRSKKTGL